MLAEKEAKEKKELLCSSKA